MRKPFLFPVGPLRAEHSSHGTEHGTNHAGGFRADLSGQRGSAVRHGDAWMDVGVRASRSGEQGAGTVSGGWQRTPGAGRADGGDVRATGGRDLDGSPRFDQSLAPGAYLWWYVDALSDCGNYGLTIIAFVGSVFSPYYRSAFARGEGDPENHVAINVALYGAKQRWTMTERSRDSMQRDTHSFRVGPSALTWDGNCLEIAIQEFGMPVPWPVRGKVRVYPQALSMFGADLDAGGLHRWGPIAACARVEAEFTHPAIRWKGHGYLDSNEGDEPIDCRFREWDWSRATLADGSTAVIYDVQPKIGDDRVIAQRFFPDGRVEPFTPPMRQALPKTGWRIDRRQRSDDDVPVSVIEQLEDTPFYQRAVLARGLFGQRVISVHETLNVPRLVSPIVQRMLPFRMPRFR